MATTLKLRTDIKKLKGALSSKSLPAPIKAKLKAQLDKAQNELKAMQSGAKPRKVSTTKGTKTALTSLQKLVNKKKFSVYQGKNVDLKKDADEGALAVGRRVSKGLKGNQFGDKKSSKGHIYYEYRANRLDVKQPKGKQKYPKLKDGGYMAKGGKIENQYEGRTASDIWKNLDKSQRYEFLLDHEDVILGLKEAKELPQFFNGDQKRLEWNKLDKDVKKAFEQHIMYGEYKKGGKTQGYDDREDERLGMEYGKMSSKDLNSTHARRDDARFEERGKMADGGELNVNDIINKFGNYINTDEAQKKWDNSTEEERLRACGYNSDYQNVKFNDLPIYVKSDVSQYYFLDKYGERTTNKSMFKTDGGYMAKGGEVNVDDIKSKMYGLFKGYLGNFISEEELISGLSRVLGKKRWFRYFKNDTGVNDVNSVKIHLSERVNKDFEKEQMQIAIDEKGLRVYDFKGNEMMAKGGKVRSQEEFNELVVEKQKLVKNLSPKEVAEMWNKNSNSPSKMTEDEAKMSNSKMYLADLLVEKELTEEEHNKYFEHGGMMAKGGETINFKVGDVYHDVGNQKLEIVKVDKDAKEITFKIKDALYTISIFIAEHNVNNRIWTKHGGYMAKGGVTEKEVVESNAEMVLSKIKEVHHHADELGDIVSKKSDIEAWVVAKIERASTDLSDITHYLDGQHEKMSMGGSINNYVHKMDKK